HLLHTFPTRHSTNLPNPDACLRWCLYAEIVMEGKTKQERLGRYTSLKRSNARLDAALKPANSPAIATWRPPSPGLELGSLRSSADRKSTRLNSSHQI